MDKRGREAEKRYRGSSKDTNYVTISLILNKDLVDFIEEKLNKTEDRNMSKFIEEKVSEHISDIKEITEKRKYKEAKTVKKTFTFTDKFVKKIKSSKNMSLTIEKILTKKFNLN